jgi:hypothetical protein
MTIGITIKNATLSTITLDAYADSRAFLSIVSGTYNIEYHRLVFPKKKSF